MLKLKTNGTEQSRHGYNKGSQSLESRGKRKTECYQENLGYKGNLRACHMLI